MRAVVDQYHSLNHYDSDDPYVKYVINTFTPEMVERCFEIAREDLIRIYELDAFAIPKNSTKYCSFDSIKNEEFDIYNFVEKHSIIGKVCEVL
ncbi:MAG: hypothetical protein J6A75_10760 [Lachnospiraceae bacterium]|nr:hypothetical protein [Lachnospiraceae bacterium]